MLDASLWIRNPPPVDASAIHDDISARQRTAKSLLSHIDDSESPHCLPLPHKHPKLRPWGLSFLQMLGLAPLQKCVGDFCCINFGGFCRGFCWRIFLGIFPTKMRRKNPARKSAKKSGGPKIKICEKSVLPKTDPNKCLVGISAPEKIFSAPPPPDSLQTPSARGRRTCWKHLRFLAFWCFAPVEPYRPLCAPLRNSLSRNLDHGLSFSSPW